MKNDVIGIIGAMDCEVAGIVEHMTDTEKHEIGKMMFYTGKLGEKDVVVAKCGVGKVFAAMCAQAMIISFAPSLIINTGIAGTLNSNIGVLGMVIGKRVAQHDFDTSAIDGCPRGYFSWNDSVFTNCDEKTADSLLDMAKKLEINAICGTIASGDEFIADSAKKQWLRDNFGADACEMEGASIGHVCAYNGVPFCVVRTISDGGDDAASMDYPTFADLAAKQSIKFIVSFISGIAEEK